MSGFCAHNCCHYCKMKHKVQGFNKLNNRFHIRVINGNKIEFLEPALHAAS